MRHLPVAPARCLVLLVLAALCFAACGDRARPAGPIVVDVQGDPIRLRTPEMTVETSRAAFRLAIRLSGGDLLTREHDEGGAFYERDGVRHDLGAVLSARAIDGGAELEIAAGDDPSAVVTLRVASERTLEVAITPGNAPGLVAVGSRWHSPRDESIYGLTQRLRDSPLVAPGVVDVPAEDLKPVEVGSLDRRGEIVEMFIRPTFSLYAPFFQSSRGYGLAIAGTAPGSYDVAASDPETLAFRFETGNTDESRQLRYRVFVGPEHATILDEYTRATGRPLVPPDWAFLPWRWRDELAIGPPAFLDGVAMNAEVVDDVTMLEQLGIPAGVYMLDRPVLQGEFGFSRFAWDEERLPNASAMLDALHRRGYRVITWTSTWACGSEPLDNGSEAYRLGFLAPGSENPPRCADVGGTSFILDVTNPDARSWWAERLRDFAIQNDLDGFKLDRGEEHIPSDPADIWADGRNGRHVHNDYVVLQTELHHQALSDARPDGDFVLFTRSGYTGTQQHSIVWGGDIPGSEDFGGGAGTDLGLRAAIIGQLRAAFMGFPIWGSDTGGYYEFKDREVFARWIEFSAFSGIMEIGGKGTHAPWNMPTEPAYDEEMIEIYRRYSRIRVALAEYISRAAAAAGASGLPIARPMVFFDREDERLRDLWDQYLFGPDLMVAPVWRVGQRTREVYFPAGTWRSWWNASERHEGPATVTVDVPLDRIPVYVRGDADVPAPPG